MLFAQLSEGLVKILKSILFLVCETILDQCNLSSSLATGSQSRRNAHLRIYSNLDVLPVTPLDIVVVLVEAVKCDGYVLVGSNHFLSLVELLKIELVY